MSAQVTKFLLDFAKSPVGSKFARLAYDTLGTILPVDKIKETSKSIAFIHPEPESNYKEHLIVVPKRNISSLTEMKESDHDYVLDSFKLIQELAQEKHLDREGYTVLLNTGSKEQIKQLHFHVLVGKK